MFLLRENNVFLGEKKKERNTSFLPSMVFLKSTTQFTKNVTSVQLLNKIYHILSKDTIV